MSGGDKDDEGVVIAAPLVTATDGSGIYVSNDGTGSTSISTIAVAATGATGIYVENGTGAGDVVIEAISVAGTDAIHAAHNGNGDISVTVSVAAGTYTGIYASTGGNLTVDVHDASGSDVAGLNLHAGGTADVTVRGTVEGGVAGVNTSGPTVLTITGTDAAVRNESGASDAQAVIAGGDLKLINGGTLTGEVDSSAGNNSITNNGVWMMAGGTSEFAGAANTLKNNGTISAAGDDGSAETTSIFGVETITTNGVIGMADGVGGDLLRLSGTYDSGTSSYADAAVTFGADAVLSVDLDGTGTDRVEVTGTVVIEDGARIAVSAASNPVVDTPYLVLHATGGVTGDFGVQSATAFLGLTSETSGNDVFVTLKKVRDLSVVQQTGNQGAVADGLDQSGPLFDALLLSPDDDTARASLDMLSGDIHPSLRGALLRLAGRMRQAMQNRLADEAVGDTDTDTDAEPMAFAAVPGAVAAIDAAAAEPGAAGASIWASAIGGWTEAKGDGNAGGYTRRDAGIAIGADTRLGGWQVGLVGAYQTASVAAGDRPASAGVESLGGGLYAGRRFGIVDLELGTSAQWDRLATTRTVSLPGINETLTASYDALALQGFADIGVVLAAGAAEIEPFAGLAVAHVTTGAFMETGGTAVLGSNGEAQTLAVGSVGVRAAMPVALVDTTGRWHGAVELQQPLAGATPLSSLRVGGTGGFEVAGVPLASTLAVATGIDIAIAPNLAGMLNYAGHFSGASQAHDISLGINGTF